MSEYRRLQEQLADQMRRYYERRNQAADVIDGAVKICVDTSGVPAQNIDCHEPTDDLPETGGKPAMFVIKEKANGAFGVTLAIRIDAGGRSSAYMFVGLRPEVRFEDSTVKISLSGEVVTEIEAGDVPERFERAKEALAGAIMRALGKHVAASNEPQEGKRGVLGFHPNPNSRNA